VLLLGSLLPLANWIPGGERDPMSASRLADWALGLGLCTAFGVLVWFTSRHAAPAASRIRSPLDGTAERRGAALISALAFLVYGAVALVVFSGRPLLIDEIVQVLQAQDLAAFRLTHPIDASKAFFSILNEVDFGNRAYGQYPIGGPAMLTVGVWLGAPWLVGPLAGGLSAWLFWLLLREVEGDSSAGWRLGATALFALAPFAVFMFGSHMNHATLLLWVLAACVALARAIRPDAHVGWGLATGLALGAAATIRPLDAVAFALPAGAWLLWRARRGGRPFAIAALSGVGVAIPMFLQFWANVATTGDAFTFGYDLLWGEGHGLGFHTTPWGVVHTPARGFELIGLYLARLNTYLFELPFPSLLIPALGLWWWRDRLRAFDGYLLVSAGLIAIGYWAYWHDGFFRGPRFVFAWLPVLVLWTARGLRAMSQSAGQQPAVARGLRAALIAGAAYAVVTLVLVRVPTYRNSHVSMRLSSRPLVEAGVKDALVLVQESWGAQLMVRLWAVGVSRPESEVLYRSIDACVLEEALTGLEQQGSDARAALLALRGLSTDSARLVAHDLTPDSTVRRLPGLSYSARCLTRLEGDRAGYLLYAPWRLVRDGNVYARWLPGREAEIAAAFPGRAVYRLRRNGSSVDAPLLWEAVAPARAR
jgi:hypothetical protein